MLVACELAFGGRRLAERVVRCVDGANAQQPLQTDLILADGGFEELAAALRPTSD